MKIREHGAINWESARLLKWEAKEVSGTTIHEIKFLAHTFAGGASDEYSKKMNADYYVPSADFIMAKNRLKPLILRAMDWEEIGDIHDRISIAGLEMKYEGSTLVDIYLSFEYTSEGTGFTTLYRKGAHFSGHDGFRGSLEPDEYGRLVEFINEIVFYLSRRKGDGSDLFSNDWDESSEDAFVNVKIPKN